VTRLRGPFALSLLALGSACTEDAYVVGAVCGAVGSCPAGGASSGGNASGASSGAGSGGAPASVGLVLDLTGSGVDRLPQELLGEAPSHFLVADDASAATWVARVGTGFEVVDAAALALAEPAPFADPGSVLSHSGSTTFSSESTWADTSAGALALEAVFRAEPGARLLEQQDAEAGLQLSVDVDGRLNLRLDAGDEVITASSPALVVDAWHHCLALFDAAQAVAQIFCNGQAGATVAVPAGFGLQSVAAPVTLGDASPARVSWAELARWQGADFGPRGSWTDLARERFARLVGTYAEGANEPLPFAEVRASGAYVDMSPSDAPQLRRLHPVGEHWPRIVCRPTSDSPRTCGLLVEAASSQPLAPEALELDNWDGFELDVNGASAPGPTGAATLFALSPSAVAAEHALELDAALGDGPAVFSFFARAESAHLLRAEVLGVASATFDLEALTVVDESATLLAEAETWGDGLVRLSFSFDVDPGPARLRLALLADDASAVFAGDGGIAAHVGGVELRFRSFSTPLPTFGAIQQADHLVYPAGNGNLPGGPAFDFSAEIWLPAAPLVADAAILNANFSTRYDQQINLFVSPADGAVQFWGLQGEQAKWQFSNPRTVIDGAVHLVSARVGPDGATLSVDGASVIEPAADYDLSVLDRVEIGTSTSSSGPLTGIVRRIVIAP
jgi:hypothetical protein